MVAASDLIALGLILKYWARDADYGTATLVVTLFGALQLLGEAGLPAALVQRDPPAGVDADARLSTMYWLGLITGGALYGAIWIAAPWIASARGMPELEPLFRIVGLLVVIRPLYTTHQAMLRRELRFRELSLVRIVANIVELAVKLTIAIAGAPVLAWALGPIARELIYAIGVPRWVAWRARRIIRPSIVRADYRFGIRANGGEFLFQVYSNLDYQIVGSLFGSAAVGVYRAAYELVLEPVRFLSGVITVVAFPSFARLRTARTAVVDQFIAFTRQNLVVVLAFIAVILAFAEPLLTFFFGARYAAAADTARILVIVGAFRALSHLGPPLLDGLGRPDLTLRYQLTAALLVSAGYGGAALLGTSYFAVAIAWAVCYPIAFAVLWHMVLDQLGLRAGDYLRRVVERRRAPQP